MIAVYGHNGVLRSGNKFKVWNCQDYRQVSFYDYQMAPFDTAAGYVIREVFVDEVAQGPVPAYTFYAVDADHTIRAEFLNTGINELPEELIAVYPNPTNGKVTVSGFSANIRSVSVFDIYGKQLCIKEVYDDSLILDLTHCSAGIYFLHILLDNDGEQNFKIIKN